jgi:DNA-binding transcriptional ArsR family regulator
MTDKKLRKTVDALRSEMQELSEAIAALRTLVSTQEAAQAAVRQQRASKTATAATQSLRRLSEQDGGAGRISAYGVFEAAGEGGTTTFQWSLEEHPLRDVLDVDIELAAQVLAAAGHAQRLGILLMLLPAPATANEVVTALSLGTTGAAYHHLNVLQAAGLVEQRQRGLFSIVPEQVPVILTILAALSGAIGVDISGTALAQQAETA